MYTCTVQYSKVQCSAVVQSSAGVNVDLSLLDPARSAVLHLQREEVISRDTENPLSVSSLWYQNTRESFVVLYLVDVRHFRPDLGLVPDLGVRLVRGFVVGDQTRHRQPAEQLYSRLVCVVLRC